MKITIELTEEDAAAIWADNWGTRSVEKVIEARCKIEASQYRHDFPNEAENALDAFRRSHPPTTTKP